MSQPAADRNLLFGILALQMDFISRDTLIAAMHAWVLDKSKPLGQILRDQGQLSGERLQLLDALVEEHLRAHGNDAQHSLASLSSVSSIKQSLQAIDDPELHFSLGVAGSQAAPRDSISTVDDVPQAGPRFRILRPHAKGGLGAISVAEDLELHREVALKEIQERHADNPHSRGRFLLEAEITGGLEHPGIVPVYSLGSYADGRPFYAMRFVKGDNLMEAIKRFHEAERPGRDPGERSLAFRQLLGRFVDVCQAVAYAHSRGVLHRDLKPGNIMLGTYGETLVVDWGLAKAVGRALTESDDNERTLRPSSGSQPGLTQAGSALGTPAYMSPEQAAGRLDELGPASDVYSLGATLYTLLAGQAPFRKAEDMGETLRKVKAGEFPKPREVVKEVPAALEAVCLKAMALRPQERYSTALTLAADVEHWLADEPVSAYPEPLPARLARWHRRHRTLVSSVAAALLVATAALSVAAVVLNLAWEREKLARQDEADQRRRAEAATEFLLTAFRSPDPWNQDKDVTVADRLDLAATRLEQEFADDPVTKTKLLDSLGLTYSGLGMTQKAVTLFERARQTQIALGDPDGQDTLTTMNNLAYAYLATGRHGDALPLFEETHKRIKAKHGADHPDTLTTMNNLALAYHESNRLADAVPLFEETLKLRQAKLGPDHADSLSSMNNLAMAYQDAGRKAEALSLLEVSLKKMRLKHGPDHPSTLTAMNNLALAYDESNRLGDALPLFEETLKLRQAKLGPDHPDMLSSLNNLAMAYRAAGRNAEALPLLEQTLRQMRLKHGTEHSSTLTLMGNVALAHHEAGKLPEAETLLRELIIIRRRQPSVDELVLASALALLGDCLLGQGKFSEAEPVLRESLTIRDQKQPKHWSRFNTQTLLGAALAGQKKYAEAEPLLLSGYEGLKAREKQIPEPKRRSLGEAAERLMKLYDAWGKPNEADKWREVHAQLHKPAKKADKP